MRLLIGAPPAHRIASLAMRLAKGLVGRSLPDLAKRGRREISKRLPLAPSAGNYRSIRHDMDRLPGVLGARDDLSVFPAGILATALNLRVVDLEPHTRVTGPDPFHGIAQPGRVRRRELVLGIEFRKHVFKLFPPHDRLNG